MKTGRIRARPKENVLAPVVSRMSADLSNMLKMMGLLGDDGFVDALTDVEGLVEDVNETLDRVERIEGDAEAALLEANEALVAVDHRLAKFDETISLLEAKIEAGFSVGFFFFALNQYLAGELLFAAALGFMGLLGFSSLVVTIHTMPQVRRLRRLLRRALGDDDRTKRADADRTESADSDDRGDGETGRERSDTLAKRRPQDGRNPDRR